MFLMTPHEQVFEILRALAKETYWQTIYNQSKETYGLSLFRNREDFTYFQTYFLSELSFYANLLTDIYMGEVDAIVLDNFIYEDAYHAFKADKRNKERKQIKQSQQKGAQVDTKYHKNQEIINQNQWVFTKVKGLK